MPKKAQLNLEAIIKEKAKAYNLEEETLRKAVREELTSLLARDIAKQLVGGRQAVRKLPKTLRGGEQPDINLLDVNRLSVETRQLLLLELKEKLERIIRQKVRSSHSRRTHSRRDSMRLLERSLEVRGEIKSIAHRPPVRNSELI